MKILCWNVRGLMGASDTAPTQQLVLELSKKYQCFPQKRVMGVSDSIGCFYYLTLDCLGGLQLFPLPPGQERRTGPDCLPPP
ncbi:hypothetical protein LIER_43272 [Lithospermum erythrorhizon]|uniref:Uncharacterized protein n=1 Tax=Lithospermum erythrorhizon TaxID=34254 RepID=A0AAV3PRH7_LITER